MLNFRREGYRLKRQKTVLAAKSGVWPTSGVNITYKIDKIMCCKCTKIDNILQFNLMVENKLWRTFGCS